MRPQKKKVFENGIWQVLIEKSTRRSPPLAHNPEGFGGMEVKKGADEN